VLYFLLASAVNLYEAHTQVALPRYCGQATGSLKPTQLLTFALVPAVAPLQCDYWMWDSAPVFVVGCLLPWLRMSVGH